jgi:hypothetical protein
MFQYKQFTLTGTAWALSNRQGSAVDLLSEHASRKPLACEAVTKQLTVDSHASPLLLARQGTPHDDWRAYTLTRQYRTWRRRRAEGAPTPVVMAARNGLASAEA